MSVFSSLIDADPKFRELVITLEKAQKTYDEMSALARTHAEYCMERGLPTAPDDRPKDAFRDVIVAKIVLAEYVMEHC